MEEHAGHRKRKLAQFRRHGLEVMAEHEALELLLFFSIPRQDTNLLAHRLISQFGSLSHVLSASAEELETVPGVGEYTATLLTLVPQINRLALVSDGYEQTLDSTEALGDFFLSLLVSLREERSYQVCMDSKGKQLCCRLLNQGSPFATGVSVRDVAANALQCSAVMVALGHNHTSGVAFPSDEDLSATDQIQDALDAVGVHLVDHIIVANRDYTSMRLSGLL